MMSKIDIFMQPIEFVSLSALLRLKNYVSYRHYLRKQSISKENLEVRIKNSIGILSDIRTGTSSNEKWDKIKDCEYGLHKISQSDVDITNKNTIEKIKVSKASFKAFLRLENNFSVVESSLQDLSESKVEQQEINALEQYINCLYTDLYKESTELFKNFEKKHKGTVTSRNCRKNELKKSDEYEKINYFNSVLNDLIQTPPSYDLNGDIINKNYKIRSYQDGIRYKRGKINLECSYKGNILDLEHTKVKRKPNVICYVAGEISTPFKDFVKKFNRPDKLLFSYSMCEEKLYTSPHPKSDIYSRYFDPKKSPLSVEEILYYSQIGGVKNV
ncbi:MAG: hypothetical protein JSW73_03100 [Candidatus Woesearchaeota archaeon]|nr:MAG: hypothetical protein JSW73_03100 [Candidatus Woesearchaeota archaeon]